MARRNSRERTSRLALSAMLLAMMLILGYVEAMLPLNVGVPGIKLGLSNGVLIFAVYMLDIPAAYTLMALKVILSGLMFSGVSAMMYGLCGGLVSLTGMVLLSRIRRLPVWAVSAMGGILHNAGQIGLSLIILNLPLKAMLVYLAWLTAIGAVCGFLTGTCAQLVMKHLRSGGFRLGARERTPWKGMAVAAAAILTAIVLAWLWAPKAAAPQTTPEATPAPVFSDDGHAISFP